MGKNTGFDGEYGLLKDTYIIGVHRQEGSVSKEALNHELSHAFYTLYSDYRKSCDGLLIKISTGDMTKATAKLLKMSYAPEVIKDELQAYFSTTESGFEDWRFLWKRKEFADNFQNFKKGLKEKENNGFCKNNDCCKIPF